jgi:hypothetical protein
MKAFALLTAIVATAFSSLADYLRLAQCALETLPLK